MNHARAGSRSSARPVPSDVWGGLAAMLVALPAAIAYGVLVYAPLGGTFAGAGAIAGILGAITLGIVAPLVGRNPGFVTAPCAPAAAVLSGLGTQLVAGGGVTPELAVGLLALAALLSGLLQIVYGLVGAGRLIKFLPYQVVSGFLSGVALIIAVGQLPKLLGVPSGTPLTEAVVSPALWKWPGVVVGLVTIVVTATAPRVTTKVPASIVGLASGIATYFGIAAFRTELLTLEGNALVIGTIEAQGSVANVAAGRVRSLLELDLASVSAVAATGVTLSVLLSIDTLKTGVVLDALTKRRHDSNRELVGQGVANVASFFTGGMAGAATTGASLVNVTSGGKTVWSAALAGTFALVAYAALRGLMAWVPIGALAGILLVVSFRMFDFKMFLLLRHRATLLDFGIIAAVTLVAELVGLIEAAAVGVALAVLLFMRVQIRSEVLRSKRDLRTVRSKRRRSDAANEVLAHRGAEAVFIELQNEIFFGTTDKLLTQLDDTLAHARFLLVDLRRVDSMDFTAIHLFEQMRQRLAERRGCLSMCGMPSNEAVTVNIEAYLHRLGDRPGLRIFETRDAALEWMEDQLLEAEGRLTVELGPALTLGDLPLIAGLRPEVVAFLEEAVAERTVSAGQKVFSRGDAGDEMFLVRSGRVQILLPLEGGKRHHLATFCEGETFGEMAFLDGGARSADAEAAVDTSLFVLTRPAFDTLAAAHPDVAAAVFERLAKLSAHRLRLLDVELRAVEER